MAIRSTPLNDVLGTQSKVRALRVLLGTTQPLSGREIARQAGMSKTPIELALAELVRRGVAMRHDTPTQALYRIEITHPLVTRLLVPLFASERAWVANFLQPLRSYIRAIERRTGITLVWAGLYGSVARGDDEAGSDLDLALVTASEAASRRIRAALSDPASPRFVATMSPIVISRHALLQLRRHGDPLVIALLADGRRIAGTVDLEQLVNE